MFTFLSGIALSAALALAIPPPQPQENFEQLVARWRPCEIKRDVAVIGGGSSGTYSAIRLKDSGKSVVVVEAKDTFGGHTETYFDEASGIFADYGVVILHNNEIVKNYYQRLGVPLAPTSIPFGNMKFFDFGRNQVVPGIAPKDPTAAVAKYAAQLAKYPFLSDGSGWAELPDPIPEDLLLPLEDFLRKYDAIDAIHLLAQYNQGIGNPLNQTTVYMAKQINLDVLANTVSGFVANANGNNHEIYDKAQAELGEDALINSKIIAVDRSKDKVRVLLSSDGQPTLIKAKKLLVAIQPKPSNLAGWDLSQDELSLFSKFKYTGYYTGLLKNTGFPANLSVNNVGIDVPYNLPSLPGPYFIAQSKIPGIFDLKYGTEELVEDDAIKAMVRQDLTDLASAGLIDRPQGDPEFVRFSSHNPFAAHVSVEELKGGFYKKLYALQGQRNTYYTGAAFEAQDSSMLWAFSERQILPLIRV